MRTAHNVLYQKSILCGTWGMIIVWYDDLCRRFSLHFSHFYRLLIYFSAACPLYGGLGYDDEQWRCFIQLEVKRIAMPCTKPKPLVKRLQQRDCPQLCSGLTLCIYGATHMTNIART